MQDLEVENKIVLLRVDFNVPLDRSGKILDDFRIMATRPTIDYLIGRGCKIILLTHFSKAAGLSGEIVFNLENFAQQVSEVLGRPVGFVGDLTGGRAKEAIQNLQNGQLLLLDNLRNDPGEKQNDSLFAAKLASLGDIYINDAFGVCHRRHASVVKLPELLPSGAGLLLQKEIQMLGRALKDANDLTVIVGGAKISTKIKFISRFLSLAKNVLVGGALANNLLKQKGLAIGQSLVEKNLDAEDLAAIDLTSQKLHLPIDAVVALDAHGANKREKAIGRIASGEIILDIGPETQKLFGNVIASSKTVIWNGPMGFFENTEFFIGTKSVAKSIVQNVPFSVIGGGETILCVRQAGLLNSFSHVSTGGGAMMEFLLGNDLPGITALRL